MKLADYLKEKGCFLDPPDQLDEQMVGKQCILITKPKGLGYLTRAIWVRFDFDEWWVE